LLYPTLLVIVIIQVSGKLIASSYFKLISKLNTLLMA